MDVLPIPNVVGEILCDCGTRVPVEAILTMRTREDGGAITYGAQINSDPIQMHMAEHAIFPIRSDDD